MTIHHNMIDAIGNTPLIKLKKASELTGCNILGKAEFMNPGQSVKDRAALQIIRNAEAKGELKPGGTIVFSTINRNPKSFLFAIVGAEYILNLLPKGTHEYKKFIKPSELSSMMRNNSLEVVEVIGMSYNPITKNYWLGKDVDVNYLIHAKKK